MYISCAVRTQFSLSSSERLLCFICLFLIRGSSDRERMCGAVQCVRCHLIANSSLSSTHTQVRDVRCANCLHETLAIHINTFIGCLRRSRFILPKLCFNFKKQNNSFLYRWRSKRGTMSMNAHGMRAEGANERKKLSETMASTWTASYSTQITVYFRHLLLFQLKYLRFFRHKGKRLFRIGVDDDNPAKIF